MTAFHAGQPVRVLVATLGTNANDDEISYTPGAKGVVVAVERLPAPQGVTIHVEVEDEIMQVFDESDGPVERLLVARDD